MKPYLDPKRVAKGLYWQRAWSVVAGCSPASPGCANCWAAKETAMRSQHPNPAISKDNQGLVTEGHFNGTIRINSHRLHVPISATKPVVWSIWTDLFHQQLVNQEKPHRSIVPADVFGIMSLRPDHRFLVCTKRPELAAAFLGDERTREAVILRRAANHRLAGVPLPRMRWPLPNVFIGATCENQEWADRRRPAMEAIAAAGWETWVSSEPRLSAIAWDGWEFITWLVSGCESGTGARPSDLDWFRADRAWCEKNNIPFWLKQVRQGRSLAKAPELDDRQSIELP